MESKCIIKAESATWTAVCRWRRGGRSRGGRGGIGGERREQQGWAEEEDEGRWVKEKGEKDEGKEEE